VSNVRGVSKPTVEVMAFWDDHIADLGRAREGEWYLYAEAINGLLRATVSRTAFDLEFGSRRQAEWGKRTVWALLELLHRRAAEENEERDRND